MKKLLFLFLTIVSICFFTDCKISEKKKNDNIVVSDTKFNVVVGNDEFTGDNEVIFDAASANRDLPSMDFAVNYLSSIADATIAFIDIKNSVKGDKITTYQFWIKIVPATLPHTKTLFNAFINSVKVSTLYESVGKLSPEEQLAVGLKLKAKFKDLPLGEAEGLANTILSAALITTKLVSDIQALKK